MATIIIDHDADKIHSALGLKEDYLDDLADIVTAYFVTPEDQPGHSKASICLERVINLLKKKIFAAESPIQEYEASLAYLSFLVGAEIARNKNKFDRIRDTNPIVELLREKLGIDALPQREATVFKCDSPEEGDLYKAVIHSMSTGQFGKAMGALIRLKDIKEGGKTSPQGT